MALLSIRAYARHRAERGLPGTSHTAVQKAIKAGRVHLAAGGKIDPEEADRLWTANTDAGHRRNPGQERAASRPPPPADGDPVPDYQESRARREAAEAALAEIELAEKEGRLIKADDVESRLVNLFSSCRTKLMGVPARARQQDPGLTGGQIALLDDLLREALEDLSAAGAK